MRCDCTALDLEAACRTLLAAARGRSAGGGGGSGSGSGSSVFSRRNDLVGIDHAHMRSVFPSASPSFADMCVYGSLDIGTSWRDHT